MFLTTVLTIFRPIFELFLISAAAGVLVRKNIVSQTQIRSLSGVTINVFLPCLIISKTISQFDPAGFPLWWTLPLSGVLMVLGGMLLSGCLLRFRQDKLSLLPMASMQNGIFIVLPIGLVLFPDQFDLFALYCFLLIMGITPLMWSIGKVLITGKKNVRIQWRDFITPPLTATLVSILLVFSGLSTLLPSPLMGAMDLLGQATVPLAVFVLGATLGTISYKDMPPPADFFIVAVVKFILIPSIVFSILYTAGLYRSMPLFSSMMIIQSSSPPATNLILMVRSYGSDTPSISSMMLLLYILCLPAMPLWLALWRMAVK